MDEPVERSFGRSRIVLLPIDTVADVALRSVRDHLLGETGIEVVMFVLRGDALAAFTRRLAAI